MRESHRRSGGLSLRVALSLAAILLFAGFACGRPNPSDAALGQVMQETRDDLKKAPENRDNPMLNLTKGAQMAVTGKNMEPGNNRLDAYIEDSNGEAADPQEFELQAIALAQEGELALISGDEASGMSKLEESMQLYPTLDALRVLAPELEKRSASQALQLYCEDTFLVQRLDSVRLEVLKLCYTHSGAEDVHVALPWASEDILTWYEAQR